MFGIKSTLRLTPLALTFFLAFGQTAYGHLMEAQHGTLNFVDDGAFLVLSLPTSAFPGIDENEDGRVSMIEFNNQRAEIFESVSRSVTLRDAAGLRPLEGVMLSPEIAHDASIESVTQLTVLGRFNLSGSEGLLRLGSELFGQSEKEQSVKMTVTNKTKDLQQELLLTPGASSAVLFANAES